MSIKAIPNLIQGVSQQSPQQRRDSQCEEQFDCINSPLDGCFARPAAVLTKLYAGANWADAFFTETSHGDENYLVGITNADALFGIDLADGTACTMTGADTDGYRAAGAKTSALRFRAQTVEDTTFIVNRQVKPSMTSAVSATRRKEALVFVRSGAFESDFKVVLSGPATVTATVSTDVASPALANAGYIAQGLYTAINGVSGYTCEISGSSLLIYRGDGADFDIFTSDENGDEQMLAFKESITSYSKLPSRAFPGVLLKVGGESRTANDDFYVSYQGSASSGRWGEVIGGGQHTTLDKATMPHTITNTGYRAFTWASKDWSTRIAGDETTVKDPSFVGKFPRDLFWYERRLALAHEAGVVWSKTDFPYTFFPDTAQTLLATAPVDTRLVAASGSARGTTSLDFSVQLDEGLALWAQKAQFRISSGQETFRQDTVSAKVLTAYEYNPLFEPQSVSSSIFFAADSGLSSLIRTVEYNQGKPLGEPVDVSAHVGSLIPAGLAVAAMSDSLRMLVTGTALSQNLYVYNYLTSNREFIQSAWNVWRIPGGNILWAGFRNSKLRLIQQRPEGVAYLTVDMNARAVDFPGAAYFTRLDLRVNSSSLVVTYDSASDTSSFTLPYTPTGPAVRVVTTVDLVGGFARGREFLVTSGLSASVVVKGDLTGYTFVVGQAISAERLESEFFIRSDTGVVPTDRLTVNSFQLEVSKTGYTRIEVSSPNKPTSITSYEGRELGTSTAVVGEPQLGTNGFVASVGEESSNCLIRLVNDSFMPSNWQTANYDYTAIGRAAGK